MTRKVVLYCRVSTADQAREGYSIDEQIERLTKYAESQGFDNIEVYVDPGFSGASMNRPALQKLIADVEAGKVKKVLVYKLDRLSRSQKDTLELIEDVFRKNGCDFESMSEKFDTGTPFGNAMIGILAVFAQLERETIKERLSMGREGRAKEGLWKGGNGIPIGYDYIDGRLVVNEEEAFQIREVFDLYLQGYGSMKIADILNKKGYSHKYGNWNHVRVLTVVKNPLYIGKVNYMDTIYDGQHEPIVSEEIFEKASKLFKSKTFRRHKKDSTSLLGGIIFCKRCNARFYRWKDSRGHFKYSCYTRRNTLKSMKTAEFCDNKHWRADDLESLVLDQIRQMSLDPEKIKEASSDPHHEEKIQSLEKMLEKTEKQKRRLLDLYMDESFSKDDLSDRMKSLNEKSVSLLNEIENEKSRDKALMLSDVKKHVNLLEDLIAEGDSDKLHNLVRLLIDYIEIDGEDVFIHWNF